MIPLTRQPLLIEYIEQPPPKVREAPKDAWTGKKQGQWGDWMFHRKLGGEDRPAGRMNWSPRVKKSMADAADQAVAQLKERGVHLGPRLGQGLSGAVHKGHIKGTVVKLDKGDNEARLANHVLNNPELQKIRILPRYYQTHETDVHDKETGERIHAIHREDMSDFNSVNSAPWFHLKQKLNQLGYRVRMGRITHEDAVNRLHGHLEEIGHRIHPTEKHHYEAAAQGIRQLADHGIIPCDLHASNFGFRHNGEFAMRDVGCYSVTERGFGKKVEPKTKQALETGAR